MIGKPDGRQERFQAKAGRSMGLSPDRSQQPAGTQAKPTWGQKVRTFARNAVREPSYMVPLVLTVVIIAFMRPYYVPSGSMIPTLLENDKIMSVQVYFPNGHTFEAGDIVTFMSPSNTVYVKRVVASGGDTVTIAGDTLYVNGEKSPWQGSGTGSVQGTWELADDEYFCMGDNRGNSHDSRYIGPVKADRMISRVIGIYYPFNRMSILDTESGTE